jgi:hypothetical protein
MSAQGLRARPRKVALEDLASSSVAADAALQGVIDLPNPTQWAGLYSTGTDMGRNSLIYSTCGCGPNDTPLCDQFVAAKRGGLGQVGGACGTACTWQIDGGCKGTCLGSWAFTSTPPCGLSCPPVDMCLPPPPAFTEICPSIGGIGSPNTSFVGLPGKYGDSTPLACNYPMDKVVASPAAVRDYVRTFITGKTLSVAGRNNYDKLMGQFCAQRVDDHTLCSKDIDQSIPLRGCSRVHALTKDELHDKDVGGDLCGTWYNGKSSTEQLDFMTAFCNQNSSKAGDCMCVLAAADPRFADIALTSHQREGCWYAPCMGGLQAGQFQPEKTSVPPTVVCQPPACEVVNQFINNTTGNNTVISNINCTGEKPTTPCNLTSNKCPAKSTCNPKTGACIPDDQACPAVPCPSKDFTCVSGVCTPVAPGPGPGPKKGASPALIGGVVLTALALAGGGAALLARSRPRTRGGK